MRIWHYAVGMTLSVVLPFLYYLWFHDLYLVNSQVDWGSFGSYMSGVAGPLVGGITLMFLLVSFRYQARTVSTTAFFSMVSAHLDSISKYRTEYSCDIVGLEYLQWLWQSFYNQASSATNTGSASLLLKTNAPEILPMVYSIMAIIRFVDEDENFDQKMKQRYISYFWSRISGVEKKLLLSMAVYDDLRNDFKPLIKKYESSINIRFSAPEGEEPFISKLFEKLLLDPV